MKLSHHMLCLYLSHPFSLQYLHLGLPTLKGKRAVFADSVTVNGHKANFSVSYYYHYTTKQTEHSLRTDRNQSG